MSSDPKESGARTSASQTADGLERDLAQWLLPSDAPAPKLAGLLGELEAQLAAERGPRAWLRSRATSLRLLFAFLALLAPAAVGAIAEVRPDMALYPLGRMIAVVSFLVAALTTAVMVALRPLHRPALPVAVALATVGVSAFGLGVLYALPAAHTAHPASLQAPGLGVLFANAWPCLLSGLAIGATVLWLLLALDRGGLRRALVLAAASGLSANLVLQLHCPNTARTHVLLSHFGVLALLLLVAVFGERMARGRRATRD